MQILAYPVRLFVWTGYFIGRESFYAPSGYRWRILGGRRTRIPLPIGLTVLVLIIRLVPLQILYTFQLSLKERGTPGGKRPTLPDLFQNFLFCKIHALVDLV